MKLSELVKISNPNVVKRKFAKYKGEDDATLSISEKPNKKYKVEHKGKTIHFGSNSPDFTKTNDETKRSSYLARSAGIRGDWKNDKYSKNNLARNLLW